MTEQLASDFAQLFSRVFAILGFFWDTALIWGPILVAFVFTRVWLRAKRIDWISRIEWTTLEIKLPRDITKSPKAMEVVMNVFHQTTSGNFIDRYFKGRVRHWFSLELASIEGDVKFFIHTPQQYKDIIEAQIYSQYPSVEIHEVPDYTRYVDYRGDLSPRSNWKIWGTEFELDKSDAYPIKTYVDWGLDREGIKEEEKTDPMTSTIESLGALGRGEQMWVQILIRATGKQFKKPGTWFKKQDWQKEGEKLIEEIIAGARGRTGNTPTSPVLLTKVEEKKVEAIERNIAKLGFDCVIRGLYLAQKDHYRDNQSDALTGLFRQYSSKELNELKPTRLTKFKYPWQDVKKKRVNRKKKKMFEAYKRRSGFYPPFQRKPFVFNTEELATIYHFPGGVAETPTFGRIESKKGEPPPHLPR